jgi:hypothetical protein
MPQYLFTTKTCWIWSLRVNQLSTASPLPFTWWFSLCPWDFSSWT